MESGARSVRDKFGPWWPDRSRARKSQEKAQQDEILSETYTVQHQHEAEHRGFRLAKFGSFVR